MTMTAKSKLINRYLVVTFLLLSYACSEAPQPQTEGDTSDEIILTGGKSDAWDRINNPERFLRFLDEELIYTLDELPLSGRANKQPWPETYWPYTEDSTNARWYGADELSPLEKYDLVFNDWMPPPGFNELRPLERGCGNTEYDAEYYSSLGPAARWMSENRGNFKARDGIDNDGDGLTDECDDQDGIGGWWGLCHAWTPAALIENEPVRTIEYEGVRFFPSDIKALLITVYDYSRAVVLGGKCRAKHVVRDETGRIVDEDCRDTNAGSFHIITTNFLGRFNVGFAEDRTYNDEIWNQPVYSYSIEQIEEIDLERTLLLLNVDAPGTTTYPYNEQATRFAEVKISLQYVTESHASAEPTLPHFEQYLRTDRYHYILELDDLGTIIGGEWLNGRANQATGSAETFSQQPDFLWYPSGPLPNPPAQGVHGPRDPKKNPFVSYAKVMRLLDAASEQDAQ